MKLNTLVKRRLLALLIDYGVILLYLAALAMIMAIIYGLILAEIPQLSQASSHWISFLTTVLPVTLVFAWLEFKSPQASIGKQMMKLQVVYQNKSYLNALLRNFLKFLPWQIGHFGVISAVYNDYSVAWFMLANLAVVLALALLAMVIFRHDHRHLADMLAKASVQFNDFTEV